MTIYRGEVEKSTSLPRSGPAGVDGYMIRKLTKQKGDLPPYVEWHVTNGRNPLTVYVPNGLDRIIGNPYKTHEQALTAIRMHKEEHMKPTIVEERFFDDKLQPVMEQADGQSMVLVPDLTFPDHKVIPYHKPAMDFMINFAFFVLGSGVSLLMAHLLK
ncbi:hypothetical protein pEaSNUABM56_00263 [Erwinia phage pEa_SNUABM_56]|nr:hypothetical protein pEaSNUABM55_00193 [Erwinia phage pEa_SNUABM_55]UYL85283.1 hypothetical protein pEaSNUABM56_00263 [Erwinia phage pEa_SNUABM_56]